MRSAIIIKVNSGVIHLYVRKKMTVEVERILLHGWVIIVWGMETSTCHVGKVFTKRK
jgi:hypothetical protein